VVTCVDNHKRIEQDIPLIDGAERDGVALKPHGGGFRFTRMLEKPYIAGHAALSGGIEQFAGGIQRATVIGALVAGVAEHLHAVGTVERGQQRLQVGGQVLCREFESGQQQYEENREIFCHFFVVRRTGKRRKTAQRKLRNPENDKKTGNRISTCARIARYGRYGVKHQSMHNKAASILFAFFALPTLFAQSFAGRYNGFYQGEPVVLTLTAAGGGVYSGLLDDSNNKYNVSGRVQGSVLSGQAQEASLGLTLQLRGELKGNHLSLKLSILGTEIPVELDRENTAADSGRSDTPAGNPVAAKQHDQALVGSWTSQSNYNSGGYGQGSMSSESTLILLADGRVADGGSRTVVGGSGWSGSSGGAATGVVDGVYWFTENKKLYLQAVQNGKTEVQALGKYYMENNHLLITAENGSKVLFYRS